MPSFENIFQKAPGSEGNTLFNQYLKANAAYGNAYENYKIARKNGDEAAINELSADLSELKQALSYYKENLNTADYDVGDRVRSAGRTLLDQVYDLPGVEQGLEHFGLPNPSKTLEAEQADRVLGVNTPFGKVNPVKALPYVAALAETGGAIGLPSLLRGAAGKGATKLLAKKGAKKAAGKVAETVADKAATAALVGEIAKDGTLGFTTDILKNKYPAEAVINEVKEVVKSAPKKAIKRKPAGLFKRTGKRIGDKAINTVGTGLGLAGLGAGAIGAGKTYSLLKDHYK